MPRVTGGRKGLETYPQARQVSPSSTVVFVTSGAAYNQIQGNAPENIISASINLQAGSQVKVEGLASVVGSVATGRALLTSPSVSSVVSNESFGTTEGTNYRTLNFLGVTGPQPAGLFTIGLAIAVVGSAGARVEPRDVRAVRSAERDLTPSGSLVGQACGHARVAWGR